MMQQNEAQYSIQGMTQHEAARDFTLISYNSISKDLAERHQRNQGFTGPALEFRVIRHNGMNVAKWSAVKQ